MRQIFWRLTNFFFFYLGWGFCLSGAVLDQPYQGPLIVGILILIHLVVVEFVLHEVLLILSLSVFGTAVDSIFLNIGMVEYLGGYTYLNFIAPLWVTSIWALFASSINTSFGWLQGRFWLSVLLGGLGGAASYLAANRVGAAIFFPDTLTVTAIIGLVWTGLMPLSLYWAEYLRKRFS